MIKSRSNLIHALLVVENALQSKVKRVVHSSVECVISIVRYHTNVTIEDFTNLVYASSLSILLPERNLDMRNSVNSDTIEVKLLDSVVNPCLKGFSDILVVLIEVWQIGESAVLNFIRVIPVVDLALRMIVIGIIEGSNFVISLVNIGNMIGNHIEHNPNIF